MLIEQIIFSILALYLFLVMFFKMIKKVDSFYIVILIIQTIGIAIAFAETIFKFNFSTTVIVIRYILSIVIPAIIIIMEHIGKNFSEIMNIILAKFYKLTKNTKKSKEVLLALIDKYPESYSGHRLLAEIYEQEGGMRKAIDEYVTAVDLNKKDYDSYYKISYLLNELDKQDGAIEMLNNLLSKRPDYIDATMLLGDILTNQERYKEAINVYTNGLKYSSNNYDLYYSMGIVYTMLNDFQNAKICYERAATINTLMYNANYSLGQINLIEMDLDEAERHFTKCIEDEENAPDAYYRLGKIYMLRGDHENAVKFINLAIELDNNYIKIANQEPLFIPIKSKFNMPIIDEEDIKKRETSYTKKELKVREHLDKTYSITQNLNIYKIQPNRKKKEKIEDRYEREREE